MIRTCLLLLTLAAVSVSGCRKRSQPAPTPAEQPASEQTPVAPQPARAANPAVAAPSAPVSAPGVDRIEDRLPTAPSGSSKSNPVDLKLTEALQRYNEANGKMPPDFNALVTGKYISQMPQPPAGKQFAVDRAHMQVVVIGQ